MRSMRARVKASPLTRGSIFLAQNAIHALRSARSQGRPGPGSHDRKYHLTAMVRVKDEARFLPEWLAHHLSLGVEHVVVYDNNSTDGTADGVSPFVDRGLVTIVPWPTVPASPTAHLDFLRRFGGTTEWTAFFDADEFLVERQPGDLAAALSSAGDAPAVAVNWRYHGGAGHETIPAGLVTERFDRADATLNHHVKVIARPRQVVAYRNSHNFYYRSGRVARTPDGRRVLGSFVRPADAPRLVLNHYVYRSREDYERKAGRGFVDASGARDQARRADLAEREFHKHNEIVSVVPPEHRVATAALLAELGYGPEVGASEPTGTPAAGTRSASTGE